MNKTVNINLGGIFFHIDEDAYTKLKKYLDAIRRSLSDDPQGKDEILQDIESRIGELLDEKISDKRQVINQKNIDAVIEIMGKPEDYAGDEELFEEELNTKKTAFKKARTRRMFRDSEDKFLGGVSSGIAHYFDIDVTIVRILWLVSFFIFGTGALAYIILWALLPEAKTTAEKLQMQGEPVNISNIEKKIKEEFSSVSDKVKAGYEDVASHLKKNDYEEKVKTGLQQIIEFILSLVRIVFNFVGKFIGIILIIISVSIIFSLIAGGFTVNTESFAFFGDNFMHFPPSFYNSSLPFWVLSLLLILALVIPFVFLFMLGLRILSRNSTAFNKTTKSALLGVWLIAILGLVFSGAEYGVNFQGKSTATVSKHELNMQDNDTIRIQMRSKEDLGAHRKYSSTIVLDNNEEKLYNTRIDLDVREVNYGEKPHITIYKYASGKNLKNAKTIADAIEYQFEIKDNTLILNDFWLAELKDRHHNQHIDIIIYIDNGTTVYFDDSTERYLDDVKNMQNIYDRNMINHYFKMTDKGFDCSDCAEDEIETEKDNNESAFKLKIDQKGLNLKVKTDSKDATQVTIDKNGLEVK